MSYTTEEEAEGRAFRLGWFRFEVGVWCRVSQRVRTTITTIAPPAGKTRQHITPYRKPAEDTEHQGTLENIKIPYRTLRYPTLRYPT